MLRLIENGPEWKDVLPGVRIQFAPLSKRAWRAARRAAAAVLGKEEAGLSDDELGEEAGDAFSLALIAPAIVAWEGVGDAAGDPVEPTPDMVRLFLSDPRRFEACDNAYVLPIALERAEGNAFAGSPSGTSAQATPAKTTASSRAKAPRGAAAPNARTSRTSRKQKRARPSGS